MQNGAIAVFFPVLLVYDSQMKIETNRLMIRDHRMEDLEGYFGLLSDKQSMFFLPDIYCASIEEAHRSLEDAIIQSKLERGRERYFFGIFLLDGTYLGEIGYTVFAQDDQGCKLVQLGYFISKEFWNQGFVSEAVLAIIDYAFHSGDVIKIETGCLLANRYSEKIMLKFGFTREAFKKNHQWLEGKWYDRVEYGLLIENYKKSNLSL
jgi:ribosomal-protein-alanine N-acetyltransferase